MYNPYILSRTIYDANLTLKEKIIDKLPKLKIHSYMKDMYAFSLKFHLPIFSHFPTCECKENIDYALSLEFWWQLYTVS